MSTQINNVELGELSLKKLTTLYNKQFGKQRKLGSISKASLLFKLLPEVNPDGVAITVESIGNKGHIRPRETTFIFDSRKESKRWLKDQLSPLEVEAFVRDGWSYSCTAIERQ